MKLDIEQVSKQVNFISNTRNYNDKRYILQLQNKNINNKKTKKLQQQ